NSIYVLVLAGICTMAAAMGIGRFVFTPLLPGMMSDLNLSASDAGLIASSNYFGYLIGAFLAGGGWAHGHERRVLLVGLLANVLLIVAMGFDTGLSGFIVIRFFAGIASAFSMIFITT